MNSISVKTALTALFALLLLMTGALGYVAVTQISGVNENVEEFAARWFPARDAVARTTVNLNRLRFLQAEYVMASDGAQRADIEKRMENAVGLASGGLQELEKLDLGADSQAVVGSLRSRFDTFISQHRDLVQLSRRDATAEMSKMFLGDLLISFRAARDEGLRLVSLVQARAKQSREDASADYDHARWQTYLIVGLSLALGFGAMAYSLFSVSGPIGRITEAMKRLASGDTATDIPFADRTNEIGAMAGAVRIFKDNMIRARAMEVEADAAKARAEADRKSQMREMADNFERSVGGIVRTVSEAATQLQSAAQALSTSSSQTTHQATVVAAASEQASANVRTVAAAAEELSGSVREISRQVSESAGIARKAVAEAEQTNAQVSGLSAGAQKIGAIVDLINDIASKTNLLALNATIEAARAGEAGRGFAVVAAEVKALAEQTSKATAEITNHIGGVQSSTDQAAHAILGIGKTIDEINHIASTIASAVEEQGSATEEIARNVDQASQGTTEVTRNITGVNHAAEAASASANQVLSSAGELASQSEKLRREMDRFLATVRAA